MRMYCAVAFIVSMAATCCGEAFPKQCELEGYFFTDRWGQDVFGSCFVEPFPARSLETHIKDWVPLKLSVGETFQVTTLHTPTIRAVRKAKLLPSQLGLRLSLQESQIQLGSTTKLNIEITNHTDSQLLIREDDLQLLITVRKPGTPKIPRTLDGIARTGSMRFSPNRNTRTRKTFALRVVPSSAIISVANGTPTMEAANPSARQTLDANGTSKFAYEIGDGWFANEYELQLQKRVPVKSGPSVLSPPIPFDVQK